MLYKSKGILKAGTGVLGIAKEWNYDGTGSAKISKGKRVQSEVRKVF